MKTIPLTQGFVTIVDDEDFETMSKFKWYCSAHRSKTKPLFYAMRRTLTVSGRKLVSLHREVMRAQPGQMVDHISGDTLDNRKENLRVCTARQNSYNRTPGRSASGFKGISKNAGSWLASIMCDGTYHYLGRFQTPEEAARAYDAAALTHHKEFARLNFPEAA